MVQVKPAEVDRLLARPDARFRVFLLYGPDPGLVAERSTHLVKALGAAAGAPPEVVRLESADIADDPGRLADEANAIPMFGGPPLLRIRVGGNRPIHSAVESILAAPPRDGWVVLEAGDLKKTAPLRRLCESSPAAAAIACYADDARSLDALITDALQGLSVAPEAREALRTLLGADRLASRGELEKLALYAAEGGSITLADVAAVVGDAAAEDADAVIAAAMDGDAEALESGLRRLLRGGASPSVLLGAALRHLHALHRAAAAVAAGAPPAAAAERAGQYGPRRAAFERQLRIWPAASLLRAAERVDAAMAESRLAPALGAETAGEALIALCRQAAALSRGRRPAQAD